MLCLPDLRLLGAISGHKFAKSLDLFDIVKLPRLVEIGLLWRIKPEIRKPPFAGIGLDPVRCSCGLFRTEINVHRAVGIGHEIRFAR